MLGSLFKTGVLLNSWDLNVEFTGPLLDQARKMLYSKMIVGAWGLSTAKPRPFILYVLPCLLIPDLLQLTTRRRVDRSEYICGTPIPELHDLSVLMSPKAANKSLV